MKKRYVIEINQPAEVSNEEMKQYICDAVQSWKGCYHPDEELFNANFDKMKVTHQRKSKAKTK